MAASQAALREQMEKAISAGDTEAAARFAVALASLNKKTDKPRCKVIGCQNEAGEGGFCKDHLVLFNSATTPAHKHEQTKHRLKAAGKATLAGSKLEGATTSEGMEEELRHCWSAAREVVYKDLPRLARRITIQHDKLGFVVKEGKVLLPVAASGVNPSASTAGEAEPPAEAEPSADATSPPPETPVSTASQRPESPAETKDEDDVFNAISNVVWTVAQHLEDPSRHAEIKAAIDRFQEEKIAEHQLAVQKLFADIGLSSPTFAVFRAIHQSMLFPPLAQLHSRLFSQIGAMRDVRRPDGWTVLIYLGEAVTVTHYRWEQSLNEPTSPEHYEVQWSISMSFDKKMEKMRASFLRIRELQLHADMPKERKELITNVLRGNGYLL